MGRNLNWSARVASYARRGPDIAMDGQVRMSAAGHEEIFIACSIFRFPDSGQGVGLWRSRLRPARVLQEAAERQHAHLPDPAVAHRRKLSLSFLNVYNDARRADAYATLEFPGTYWLGFRDLPEI